MAKPAPAPISTPAHWRMHFGVASGYLQIMSGMQPKCGRAIYLSRLKNAISKQCEEIQEKRAEAIREHAVLKPADGEAKPEIETEADGSAKFETPAKKKACEAQLEALMEEVPVVVDFADTNMRKGAEHALKILEGDDCPPIAHGLDWTHERIVTELQLALASDTVKPKADAKPA